jgi:hypothetical protein
VRGDRVTRLLLAAALVTGLGGAGAVTTALADAPRAPERAAATAPLAPGHAAAVFGRSVPVALDIPAIGVHASLVALGLQADGTVAVPPLGSPDAGWYEHSPTPGERGPAVLLGHVDSARTGPGVFYDLRMLVPGDAVRVSRADGSTVVFRVDSVERYPKAAFPTATVYGDIDHAGVRLITCGGAFDRAARSYVDDVVVFGSAVAA